MLRPYEVGRSGGSNGRIYAIAAHVGQAKPVWKTLPSALRWRWGEPQLRVHGPSAPAIIFHARRIAVRKW